jgi:Protein of unknown function (DUF3618)
VSSEAPPKQSSPKSSAELRAEVEEARARLASTVGELGGAIDETKTRLVAKARKAAPIVGGVVGSYVALKLFRRFRGGDGDAE